MKKPLRYSKHAETVIRERKLEYRWIESAVEAPEWTIVDPSGPPVERRYCSMPELGDRVLRVVCIEDEAEIRIISAFIDRRARRPE